MKELKSSVGLGGKPGEGGEEVCQDDDDDDDNEDVIDTNRYDVAVEKLNLYRSTAVKRKLKSKFVTGKSSDQIVKNLLNMSDSEGEEDAEKRKLDKE